MILRFLVIFLLVGNLHAGIMLEPNAAFGFGDTEIKQVETATNYSHNGIGPNVDLGARVGYSLFFLVTGISGTMSWSSVKTTRETDNQSILATKSYDNTLIQTLFGGFVGFQFDWIHPIRIWGDYYPVARGRISYAEPKDSNIFAKNDKLEGSGFAVNVGWKPVPLILLSIQYRRIIYDKWNKADGTKISLPSAGFSKYKVTSGILGVSICF